MNQPMTDLVSFAVDRIHDKIIRRLNIKPTLQSRALYVSGVVVVVGGGGGGGQKTKRITDKTYIYTYIHIHIIHIYIYICITNEHLIFRCSRGSKIETNPLR